MKKIEGNQPCTQIPVCALLVLLLVFLGQPVAAQSVPNTTFTFIYNCGSTLVTRHTNPPSDVDWYWQTSSSGTSTSHGNNASITKTITGNLYLRARRKSFPQLWSSSSQSVGNVTVYTSAPAVPANSTHASRIGPGPVTVSVSTVAGATSYKWYTQSSGVPPIPGITTNSYFIPNLLATQTYYVSALAGGCESSRKAVTATIEPLPQVIINGNQCIDLENSVTLSVTQTFNSYSWKNGLNEVVGTQNTFIALVDGSYTVTVTKSGVTGTGTSAPFKVKSCLANQNLNYIISKKLLSEINNENSINNQLPVESLSQTIQYFDGFGRSMQSVVIQGSPNELDVVVPYVYDEFGREHRKYLPVVPGSSNGFFKNITYDGSGNYAGIASGFYSDNAGGKIAQDNRPFSETFYEQSPLNRPIKNYGVGVAWSPTGNNKYIEFQYLTNEHGTGVSSQQEKIIAWSIDVLGKPVRNAPVTGYVEMGGFFSSDQLFVKKTIDEHLNVVREYINKLGQTILKKIQISPTPSDLNNVTDWALTYYIYDDLGNLRYVFPPELSKLIHQNPDTYVITSDNLNSWAFQYKYDKRKRVTHKQVPGSSEVYLVYDNRDRLVMRQDGNQRSLNQWTYTKYDVLNRPVITGIYTHNTSIDQLAMSGLISTLNFFETYNGVSATHGYSNIVFPTSGTSVLTTTYYDNYNFKSMVSGLNYINTDLAGQLVSESVNVRGQVTGTKTNILGSTSYLYSISYYDYQDRVVQTISQNHKGGADRATNKFDFVGKTLETKRTYVVNGVSKSVKETFAYDHVGRLLTVKHSINAAPDVLLIKNEYNELGQLVDKKLHSTDNGSNFKQSVDYRYNIRGWLTSVNNSKLNSAYANDDTDDLFGFELGYETSLGLGSVEQYNGNISSVKWSNNTIQSNVLQRGYSFNYDAVNRLKTASHKEAIVFDTWTNGSYDENITSYDLNGNIQGLERKDGTGSLIDNLIYNYGSGATASNKLLYVSDAADAIKGFVNGNTGTDDYAYDSNGNMTIDKNKGITLITYNHLNLPAQVNKGVTNYIVYTYDATGKKLSQQVFGSSPKVTDYVGELIFENNNLQFINHQEGRVLFNGIDWEYQYNLKDHLGNVRTTFTTKQITETGTATLETNNMSVEQGEFLRYAEARRIQSYLFDYTNGSAPVTATGYGQRLNGSANERYGLAKSISVMPGDVVNVEVYTKYIDPVTSNWTTALNTLLTQIANGTAPVGTVLEGPNYAGSTSSFLFPVEAAAVTSGSSESGPKAYLNWLVFKRDGSFVLAQSGFDRISTAPKENGQDVAHERLYSPNITITEPGFVYFYVSNEETTLTEVYFDDFKVAHQINTPVIQTDDYYPGGLTFNSYNRENSTKNNYLYNGKELQDELGLDWMDYGARMYMRDILRWGAGDPLADKYVSVSQYVY